MRTHVYLQCEHVLSGAVDGGEAEGSRQSVRRLGGAFVPAVPGAAGRGAREGGRHRTAGAAAGGAGNTHHMESFFIATARGFFLKVPNNVD